MHTKLLGYIEGYYGVMLTWEQRRNIVDTLHAENMNTYIYAPKEDPYHRSQWKTPYPKAWLAEFSRLARYASDKNITLVPGIAPGLSYVYGNAGDYRLLLKKCRTFVESGITTICLLMDDIPVMLPESCTTKFSSLGAAHGALLTSLSADLNDGSHKINLWFCPSVYTDQFIKDDDESTVYLADLAEAMVPDIMILWTGPRIVPESISKKSLQTITRLFGNNVCIWDNLYANDYCPHKLFIGPYTHRPATLYNTIRGILINPTGLVHTDMFLLTLLADQARGINALTSWKQRISNLTVAQDITTLAPFFSLPYSKLSEKHLTPARIKHYKEALKKCIWDWKSPLHREWYPFLFMLDSDLSLIERSTNSVWISKKYPPVLASILNRHPI